MSAQNPPGFNRQKLYSFPVLETCIPALKVGALTGTTGLVTGGIFSILLSSKTPAFFTLASGLQWFLLGSTFWATRSTLLYTWAPPINAPPAKSEQLYGTYLNPQDRLYASTFAGGITGGAIGGLTRGRRNVVPATLMWTLAGYLGQTIYNKLDARHSEQVAVTTEEEAVNGGKKPGLGFWNKVAEMKWSPMKTMSDEQYANMLGEKVLRLEAEIALIDEEVERLRGEEKVEEGGLSNDDEKARFQEPGYQYVNK